MRRVVAITAMAMLVQGILLPMDDARAGVARVTPVSGAPGEQESVVTYRAEPGERNQVVITVFETFTEIVDPAGVTGEEGCKRPDPARTDLARCEFFARTECFEGCRDVEMRLGDGDDLGRLRIAQGLASVGVLAGEGGNDRLVGGAADNLFRGGDGRDRMIGYGTFDEGSRRNGSDTLISRGAVVDYSRRSGSVHLDLDNIRDDGERGERDLIKTPRGASLLGGRGADRLSGGRGRDEVQGGSGADRITGGLGDDRLLGDSDRPGYGRLSRGADSLSGGPGSDLIYGTGGRNILDGGSGADSLFGFGGRDRLLARDRSSDEVVCGPGGDRARLDSRDFFSSVASRRCERAERSVRASAVVRRGAETDGSDTEGVGNDTGAIMYVACPGDAPPRCRGEARMVWRGKVLATGTFSVPRNATTLVELPTTRVGRRLACRREPVATAVVQSRDRSGVLRTVRDVGHSFICEA